MVCKTTEVKKVKQSLWELCWQGGGGEDGENWTDDWKQGEEEKCWAIAENWVYTVFVEYYFGLLSELLSQT